MGQSDGSRERPRFGRATGTARRDCSAACSASRFQRSARFTDAEARCVSVRRAITGTIFETPSSVAFSIAHSMRSNLKMESSRVMRGVEDTAEISSPSSKSTR